MFNRFNHRGQTCADKNCLFQKWGSHFHRSHESNQKMVYPDVLHTMGWTPLIRLNQIPKAAGLKCEVFAKAEFFNPGGSIKDRIAIRMIEDAEEQGRLKPGYTIIEPTSGNTGIGLAMACAVKGYKCIITMPEKMSDEKVATLQALGAKVIRTPNNVHHDDSNGFIGIAKRLNEEIPDSLILGQFENVSNPLVHYDDTAEEIIQQCDGEIDMLVVGAGTGGSMTGISYKLKEQCPNCEVVGVDPVGSNLALPDSLNETDITFYEVEGIGYSYVWDVLDRQFVNRWIKIDDKVSFSMSRRLIREEGVLVGGTSGAILAGAIEAAKDLKEGQKCVVILPDSIRNYLTKFVSDNWMEARGFHEIVNEHNHWWWNHTVADLNIPRTGTIKSNISCKEVLAFLKTSKFDQLPVVDSDGTLKGFFNLKHLTKKAVSQNFQLSDTVEKVIFNQFRSVTKDTVLGLVSRILEIDEFVAVVDDKNQPLGVITHLHLLNFIANESKASTRTKKPAN